MLKEKVGKNFIITSMEDPGWSGLDIACDFINEVIEYADSLHIMAMGDVTGTNRIIRHVQSILK